jgi:hypothetical protein
MTAAAVLVLLAGRRLWHRFRGRPDRADLDRPDPPHPKRVPLHEIDDRVDQEHIV